MVDILPSDMMNSDLSRLEKHLTKLHASSGRVTVLTGAGISAESGIPTFRGPEGYWQVGSKNYRPEEMATHRMFLEDPWEVWSWYLYRRDVCRKANPNAGHQGVARLEEILGEHFRLVTQNVDGLHLRAGNTLERTFQIHGNLNFSRCAESCNPELFPLAEQLRYRGKGQTLTEQEKKALTCPRCGGLTRPHVLWFDECYDEHFFRADSTVQWAGNTDLLIIVGTSGATALPMRIGEIMFNKPEAVLLDVNPDPNPFRRLAENHPNGIVLEGNSGEILPQILTRFLNIWIS